MTHFKKNLTQYELDALSQKYNLADGHAHQGQDPHQMNLVSQLDDIFYYAENTPFIQLEEAFYRAFFDFAQQPGALRSLSTCLTCYSASVAIEMVAHLLKKRGLKTILVEPTFDNINAILKRVGVVTVAADESIIFPEPDLDNLSAQNPGALFLVLPNNPTGKYLSSKAFKNLISYCAATGVLLIVDFSFRFFVEQMRWDQYALVLDAGIDFIFIEDTGKTWPTLDLKVGVLKASDNLYSELFRIHNDFLLNVSGFILTLLTRYIGATVPGSSSTANQIVLTNRQYLRQQIDGTILGPANLESTISVEWLDIRNGLSVHDVIPILLERNVHVLPGTYFYWQNWVRGEAYLRIALLRKPEMFARAIRILKSVLPV